MTDEQINLAITEAIGADPHWKCAKNYCTDLNAMHEAEKMLTEEQCVFVRLHLRQRLENHPASRYIWHANARQRAEAFLKTLGAWRVGAGSNHPLRETSNRKTK